MNLRIICVLSLLVAHSSSMPLATTKLDTPVILPKLIIPEKSTTEAVKLVKINDSLSNSALRNALRPGLLVNSYSIEITPDVASKTFKGKVLTQVRIIDPSTNEDSIMFHVERLTITSVKFSLSAGPTYVDATFKINNDDGIVEIITDRKAELYNFLIEYTGSLDMVGMGLYSGSYNGDNAEYLAMNLHPMYARHVFPCIDEPSEETTITFTFKDIPYENIIANSAMDPNVEGQFIAMQGSPHLWGMVSHSFTNLVTSTSGTMLYGRPVSNQESQAAVAISNYFAALNAWTSKPYAEIVRNQDGKMVVFALPDTDTTWNALSTVGIWEPYVLMETTHALKQRAIGLVKIAEAMARQWFGYVVSPENFRHQWVLSGLTTYAAYDIVDSFQTSDQDSDSTLLDMKTLFVTDVIQESLLADSFSNAQVLLPDNALYDGSDVRILLQSVLNLKAPAILRMLRLVLGGKEDDFIQLAATSLLNSRALKSINTQSFYDSLNSYWEFNGNRLIDDISDFLEPYVTSNGYPIVNVGRRQGGVLLTREHFSFGSATSNSNYQIPLTYTTSVSPDFDDIYPSILMDGTITQNEELGDDDWILFNIQGQGYYRVNYDGDLWERIIEALNDPDRRQEIHPLNRATLLDDALNLARGSYISYEIALEIVRSMEHETEYAVWKAFIRNMEFVRKRLTAHVSSDDDLDQNIYARIIRKLITKFENEITFNPDPKVMEPAMVSKLRGIVMDHVCKAGYDSCIAAAVDWFYDPNNAEAVNPNIPHDLRPAVYCTMVREGGNNVQKLLYNRLEVESSQYERIVIMESLACSRDDAFINTLLEETISANSPHNTEERCRIFKAVAESSYDNAKIARNFITKRTNEIRKRYGGPAKLEEMIYALVDNMADAGLTSDFRVWIGSTDSNLDDSLEAAKIARDMTQENLLWDEKHRDIVYEWIDTNSSHTMITSFILLCISMTIALSNI